MKTIGLVIATQEEFDAAARLLYAIEGNLDVSHSFQAEFEFIILKDYDKGLTIVAAHSHFGEISAAANTQFLISEFKADLIINYGVAGAMVDGIDVGEVFVVSHIFHYDFNLIDTDHHYPRGYYPSYGTQYLRPSVELLSEVASIIPGIQRVTCMSSDSFIGEYRKRDLSKETNAQICEMECAGVCLTCQKNAIPCLILKSISDAVDEGAEAFNENVVSASDICAEILLKIIYNLKIT